MKSEKNLRLRNHVVIADESALTEDTVKKLEELGAVVITKRQGRDVQIQEIRLLAEFQI